MYRKPITYTNYNDVVVTKNFYFNLTKAEIATRELTSDGSFSEMLAAIANSNKGSEVYPEFERILKWAYGVKSADGESFIKNDAVWEAFQQSPAYSVLIMELITNGDEAAKFVAALMPADISARVAEQQAQNGFRPGQQEKYQADLDAARLAQIQQENQAALLNAQQNVPVMPAVQDFAVPAANPEENIVRQSEPRTPEIQDFGA